MVGIWAKGIRDVKNHTLAFVCKTSVNSNSRLKIAAASLYRMFIDGKFFAYGPARGAHGYSRIDEYSLKQFDNNIVNIVVEVYAPNINSFYTVDELPFFMSEIFEGDKVIASTENGDFKAYNINDRVTKVQRFSFQRPFVESYVMKRCRSNFYLGDTTLYSEIETVQVMGNILIDRKVHFPKYYRVNFTKMIENGTVTINANNTKWIDRSLYNINNQLKGYTYQELSECLSDEASSFDYIKSDSIGEGVINSYSYNLYDYGRTITGFFALELEVLENATVYVVWDEIVESKQQSVDLNFSRNCCCNVIKYVLEQGKFDLLSFEANSARYAKIVVLSGKVNISRFEIISYENPDADNMKFVSTDNELNKIVEAAKNTFAQNAVDVLTDCPSRERAGWLCDSYFSSRAERLFTGKSIVEKSFLENYIMAPNFDWLVDCMLPMCYPADHNDTVFIPNWAMWFVLELKNYLESTGDKKTIDRAKDKVYNLINYFSKFMNDDGLLENLESWVFVEWSKCNDDEFIKGVNYPSNMLYCAMLDAAGNLYDDNMLIKQANEMKKTIVKQSFNGKFFEDNRIRVNGNLIKTGHTTETCQYYAFYFGIASKNEYPELFNTLLTEFGPKRDVENVYPKVYPSNAIVGNYLRLELLLQHNLYSQVLDECKAFFTQMAELTGTLWEHSKIEASLNHGFASVAANYIVESITGYVWTDYSKKQIFFKDAELSIDVNCLIPVLDEYIEISVVNGVRNIKIPSQYTLLIATHKS